MNEVIFKILSDFLDHSTQMTMKSIERIKNYSTLVYFTFIPTIFSLFNFEGTVNKKEFKIIVFTPKKIKQ